MAINTDHIVFLIGEKETGSINKVRSKCSFLDVLPVTSEDLKRILTIKHN